MSTLIALQWLAGLVVLAEALNKMERVDVLAPGMSLHQRVVDGLKALAWMLLALGAGGAVARPLLVGLDDGTSPAGFMVQLGDTCTMLGFAVLIVRTRVKEG